MPNYNNRKYKKPNTGVTVIATSPILVYLSQENHTKLSPVNLMIPLDSEVAWYEAKALLIEAKIAITDIESIEDLKTIVIKSEPKEKHNSYTFSSNR